MFYQHHSKRNIWHALDWLSSRKKCYQGYYLSLLRGLHTTTEMSLIGALKISPINLNCLHFDSMFTDTFEVGLKSCTIRKVIGIILRKWFNKKVEGDRPKVNKDEGSSTVRFKCATQRSIVNPPSCEKSLSKMHNKFEQTQEKFWYKALESNLLKMQYIMNWLEK